MGVRKEGSGKSRGVEHEQGVGSTMTLSSGANTADRAGNESDEDSDSELQEVYVQAYACKVFNDAAAAAAVEGGEHLRPLAVPQDPEGEPLMLDRFDARWMLDLADFSKGFGSPISTALAAEEKEADSLRFAGLPSGDHSVEVDGLGKFAPTGSYAHKGVHGGLGDEEEEEPPPEVYGYYGRTAAPPSSTRGAYAATPAPQDKNGVGGGASGGVSLSSGPPGTADGDKSPEAGVSGDRGDAAKVANVEVFVPDFGVPQGLAVPSSTRQHIMMVGTARTAVRSPQLEVLLRLKQASNAAFSFLSHDDPIHPYYVFLKSWGEAALGKEYARQQQLQVERAEAKLRAEADEKERAAAAAKVASMQSQQPPPPPLPPPPPPAATDDTDGESDAPNLLGGAYDSSGDEEDAPTPSTPSASAAAATATATDATAPLACSRGGGAAARPGSATAPQTKGSASLGAGVGGGHVVEVATPDQAKREVVEKMVAFVARNGQAFEDRVRERENAKSTFDFLVPSNKFYPYYKARLALARGETPASSVPSSGGGASSANNTSNASTGRRSNSAAANTSAGPVPSHGRVGATAATAAGPSDGNVAAGGASEVGRSTGGGVRDAPGSRTTSSPSPPPHTGQQSAPASVNGGRATPRSPDDARQGATGNSGVVSGAVTGGAGGNAFEENGHHPDPALLATSGIGLDEGSEDQHAGSASSGSLAAANGRTVIAAAEGGGLGRVGGRGADTASAGRSSKSSVAAALGANSEIGGCSGGVADGGEGTARSNSSSSEDGGDGSDDAVGDTVSPGAGDEIALMMPGMSVSLPLLPLAGLNGAAGVATGAVGAAAGAGAADSAADDAETRRANRLKRARLMTGHYKLAVMEHSTGQESAADGGQQQQQEGGVVLGETTPGVGPGPSYDGGVGGSDPLSSADGLSDFDNESSSEDGGDDDDDDDDDDGADDDDDDGDDDNGDGDGDGDVSDDDDYDGRAEDSKKGGRADSRSTRDRISGGGLRASGGDRGRSRSHPDNRRRRAEDDDARRRHDVSRKSRPSNAGTGKSGGVSSSASGRDDRRSAVRRRSRSRSGSRDRGGGDRERETREHRIRERETRGRVRDIKDRSSRERAARLDEKSSSSRGSGDKRHAGGRKERKTVSERPSRGSSPELRKTDSGGGRGTDRDSSRGGKTDGERSRRRSSANEKRISASSSALGGRERSRETRGDRGSNGSGRRSGNDVREEKGRESRERRSGGRRRSRSREREDSRERVGSKRSRRR